MNARKKNHFRLRLPGFLRQTQRIAREIGDVLNLSDLIVMGENDRVTFFFQRRDFFLKGVIEFGRHGQRVLPQAFNSLACLSSLVA